MTKKRWIFTTPDEPLCRQLHLQLKIRPVYCRMLASRGIRTFEEAKSFFRPEPGHLHDPWAMKDMEKAVHRINKAVQAGEKVLIYGDYDVDGTTAVATVLAFLQTRVPRLQTDFYIPDRYDEGYGISKKGIDFAKAGQYTLIIALDCGVKAIEQITYAQSLGIDVIVCDHHLPGETLPPVYALLNPKQKDCTYPYKELSGCGIGFKLICALAAHWQMPQETAMEYLDLVMTSIAADIVPLTGENRVLAFLGLKKLNTNPLPALKALIDISRANGDLLLRDVIFMIAPRVNAAGRLGDAKMAVQLFIEKDPKKMATLAKELHQLNDRRKSLDKAMAADILHQIEADHTLSRRKTTVVFNPDWHKGVLGITASRIMDTYYRPTIILSGKNGNISGSARSVRGFNIYNALQECAPLLERFGGHFYAAGMTLKPENLEAFSQQFEEVVAHSISPEMLTPEIEIDAEVTFSELTDSFYKVLQQFEPFGPENRQPVFLLRGVKDNGYSQLIQSRHIRFEIIQPGNPNRSFAGIGFNMAEKFDLVASGNLFDICFSLEKNNFSGKSRLQLQVLDMKASKES